MEIDFGGSGIFAGVGILSSKFMFGAFFFISVAGHMFFFLFFLPPGIEEALGN